MSKDPKLRKIYGDICRGYSVGKLNAKTIYVKHLTDFEHGEANQYYEEYLQNAKSLGIQSREEKESWLIERGYWTEKENKELKQQEEYLKGLRVTLSKLAFESQIESHKKLIEQEQANYNEIKRKKEKLLGLTAESYAETKVQFFIIYLSLYIDEELKNRLLSIEELNELDEEQSDSLIFLYVSVIEAFSEKNIRKISISPYFVNPLQLCADNLGQFFGKPFFQLTSYQISLLSNGIYFKGLRRTEKIPPDILDDPDKIEEFVQKSAATKEIISKTGQRGGSTGIIGASAKDFKDQNLIEDTSFRGKNTNMLKELGL